MRTFVLAALCIVWPIIASAQVFRAESKIDVVPINNTDFEVLETRTAGPRGYWCAAGDFAKTQLRVPQNARLYIKSGRSQSATSPRYKSVIFTLDASSLSEPPNKGYLVSLRKVGYNLSVGHGYNFCDDYRRRRIFQ